MDLTVLFKLSYGMYIVSSKKENKISGQIANTVFQITPDPPMLAISINKNNLTHQYIAESGVFTVSVLSKDAPLKLIGDFGFKSGKDFNKFHGKNYKIGKNGAPIVLEHTIAYVECKVLNKVDCKTHTIFIAEITDTGFIEQGEPMTYSYYHKVKRGKSPKTAPTYIKETPKKEESKLKKYRCTVCGYVYDPEVGDPDGGIPPGTPFEDIPDDWVCPVCGVTKDQFEEI